MSSILKALRKLEEEKAALGEGRIDLARDILKRAAPQRDSSAPLVLKVVFFTVLTLALVVGAWLVLDVPDEIETTAVVVREESQPVVVPSVDPAESVVEQSIAVQPLKQVKPVEKKNSARELPADVAGTPLKKTPVETTRMPKTPEPEIPIIEINEQAIPVVEIKPEGNAKGIQPTSAVDNLPLTTLPIPLDRNNVDRGAPAEEYSEIASPPEAHQPEASVANMPLPVDLPELQISAIAFRSAPGERLAVVNDLPVMEGTSIEGVQILEIQQQGVRFSWQGMEFALPLMEENPPD